MALSFNYIGNVSVCLMEVIAGDVDERIIADILGGISSDINTEIIINRNIFVIMDIL